MAKKTSESRRSPEAKAARLEARTADAEKFGFTFSVRITKDQAVKLKAIADKDKRTMGYVAREALIAQHGL